MKFDIDLSDFKDTAIRRMLRHAIQQHHEMALPLHKRASKDGEPDEATKEQDDENDKLVDLHSSKGKPAPIPVTDEDLPEEVSDKLRAAKESKPKKGKSA